MAKPESHNRYYPSPSKTKDLHNDFRLLFDHVYALQDQLKVAHTKLADLQSRQSAPATAEGSPSHTKIGGFYVIGQPPNDADRLTFDAKTQQIVWKP